MTSLFLPDAVQVETWVSQAVKAGCLSALIKGKERKKTHSDLGVGERVGPVLAAVHLAHAAGVDGVGSGVVASTVDGESATGF